ncbi:hypothetical protein [Pseudomonas baetica]|uniref:hypothetical protein n=1 Tax=Pseudomonas baetica TaxID=674054 RepID=UPI002405A2E0|nr:hypothetical protein [Pseudomonas baetica]MDF9779309.1 hypothetical protein [Pseudomonas baetica]
MIMVRKHMCSSELSLQRRLHGYYRQDLGFDEYGRVQFAVARYNGTLLRRFWTLTNLTASGLIMALPSYQAISIYSYSPIAGVRCVSGISNETLQDLDVRGPMFQADTKQMAMLTRQDDPALRLQFALWALDKAPSEDLKKKIPIEAFILHYVRGTPAWDGLRGAPALNVILIDWPVADGYQFRAYMLGAAGPFNVPDLPFFYEQRRDEAQPGIRASMPLPNFNSSSATPKGTHLH